MRGGGSLEHPCCTCYVEVTIDGTCSVRLVQTMSIAFAQKFGVVLAVASSVVVFACDAACAKAEWAKRVVHQGAQSLTAVAGDFTRDGLPDIIANAGEKTRLFVGPAWKEVVLDATPGHDFIHSEAFDVDGDGDLDYIAARYQPGLIVWLEQPANPLTEPWPLRIASKQLNGIHGLLRGDGDGRMDLIANSAQPIDTPFPEFDPARGRRGLQPRAEFSS